MPNGNQTTQQHHTAANMPTHSLKISAAELGYRDLQVMGNLNAEIPAGQVTAIIGPNGSGKSTMLHALGRILRPKHGTVLLDDRNIHEHSTRQVARILALLPQDPRAPEGLTIRELVAFGRFPYRGWFDSKSPEDDRHVEEALTAVGLSKLAERQVATLSGGQRQRVWIAMALAQQTELILLDEPTTFLDLGHQLEVLELLRRLNQQQGKTIVMALHDLNLAARYADFMLVVADGGILAAGKPREVLTREVLGQAFGIEVKVIADPQHGTPLCIVTLPDKPEHNGSS